jgi:endoglycosylceramidase
MIPNLSNITKISGLLLLNLLDPSYLKKFFYKPKEGENHYILDKKSRISVYRGVNVSNTAKTTTDSLPWQTKEDFAKLKTWGFNLVRYMVFWNAIEPIEGSYDTKYIQSTIERLKWLQELEIDVIIDLHQDLYTNKFGGDGFPSWTIHNTDSFTQRSPWNMNYFEPAVIDSYNYFWGSTELKYKYINMLQYILTNIDSLDNVIGLDIMNEPFLGTIPRFEKTVLTEFYNDIQDMMNKNNFKTNLCFEPQMYTSAGIPSDLRFEPNRDSIYSPHFYDPFVHEGSKYTFLNKMLMKKAIDIKLREAQEFNSPLWFGEIGIESSVVGYQQYIKDFVQICNENLINFCYFSYDKDSMGIVNANGSPTGQLEALIGVYAQKIAGKNPVISSTPHSFVLDYEADGLESTEIFIPSGLKGLSIKINNEEAPLPANNIFKTIGNGSEHIVITWTD